jgi:murein DD-endopeptidase MepM/ murein hydrolase activator NlpD
MNRSIACCLLFAMTPMGLHARFLSTDPVTPQTTNGAGFHRYAYAHLRPYNFVDPDGRWGRQAFHQGESAHVLPTSGPYIAVLPTESGLVTSPFGYRIHPVTGEFTLHNGTDFRARQDAQIRSTQNGQVRSIVAGGPGGNQILVDNHDGSLSGYAHTAALEGVQPGEAVVRGQVIGRSDGSGRLTAPHLHYTYKPGSVQTPAQPSTAPEDPMQTQLKRYAKDNK